VTLLSLIDAFEYGATPEEIYQQYPSASLADVYTVTAFYLDRREEVDAFLKTAREREEQVIEQIKSRSPMAEIRRHLLARKPLPT
jgi:NH3-dependent NAD+ synthetase